MPRGLNLSADRDNSPHTRAGIDESRFHRFKRNPLLASTRDKHIFDIFLKLSLLLQIELNSDLTTFIVGDELNSIHHSILLQSTHTEPRRLRSGFCPPCIRPQAAK
jgi:hypothetical protein